MEPSSAPPTVSPSGRIAVIDVLRGLAILWVMTFHLWTDMTGGLAGVSPLYERLADRVGEGAPLAALTAAGELVLGSGYQGVTVFMILSGLSLALNAERRSEPRLTSGYASRFRRLLVPYWGGILFVTAVVAAVALAQTIEDGGPFADQWRNIHIAVTIPVRFRIDDIAWALSVFGWIFRERVVTAPVGSLWFVPLLAQYYLLFPFAMRVLRRTGPWPFVLGSVAITIVARAWFYAYGADLVGVQYTGRTLDAVAVFRFSEFAIGMTLGYLFVRRRDQVMEWTTSPIDVAGLLVIGGLVQWLSVSITPDDAVALAPFAVAGQVSLALIALPLLFKRPGRMEASVPARALIALGVVSFTALIVNDAMRYVASFIRAHDVPDLAWAFFIVAVYIPGGTLLAYLLARLFGILPSTSTRAQPSAAPQRSAESPTPGPA